MPSKTCYALKKKFLITLSYFYDIAAYFNLVIVAAGDKEGLLLVEIHASNRTIVLVKLFQQGAHAVVP